MEWYELMKVIEKDVYVFTEDNKKIIIDFILQKYSRKQNLHYCWDSFKQLYRLKIKVKPTNKFYNLFWDNLVDKQKIVFLAIDGTCIHDIDKLMLIESDKLYALLEKYYWELDEIYICDLRLKWLISVNHLFELNFIGESIIEFVQKLMKNEECYSYIIDCSEFTY